MTRIACRRTALTLALTLAVAGGAMLSHIRLALAQDADLTITRLPEDQFPILKTKGLNANFGLYGAAGNAVLRSRYGTDTNPAGEKIYVYGYQLDLKDAYDVLGHPGVTAVTLDLPKLPVLATSPKVPDGAKVYVLTETGGTGAPGIDVQSVSADQGKLTFTFAAPVHAGPTPGTGAHSLWFGFVTTTAAQQGPAELATLAHPASLQPPVNPQPSPDIAANQAAASKKTGESIAQPKPVDPTATPPLTLFLPLGPKPAAPATANTATGGTANTTTTNKNNKKKNAPAGTAATTGSTVPSAATSGDTPAD